MCTHKFTHSHRLIHMHTPISLYAHITCTPSHNSQSNITHMHTKNTYTNTQTYTEFEKELQKKIFSYRIHDVEENLSYVEATKEKMDAIVKETVKPAKCLWNKGNTPPMLVGM